MWTLSRLLGMPEEQSTVSLNITACFISAIRSSIVLLLFILIADVRVKMNSVFEMG